LLVSGLALVCVSSLCLTSSAQSIRRVLYARSRVFEGSTKGAATIKRDMVGRYYILAKPANAIWIYGPDGASSGRIPSAVSPANSIVYATDFDIDAAGRVLVADRGANAVEIFSPAGALIQKIPVFAPVSLAALPENEFAVVTLRAQAPVQIMDEHGKLIRKFGGLSDAPTGTIAASPATAASSLAEPGAIANDSAGHLYYAVAADPDPSLRKYDRYGFVSYDTALPPPGPAASSASQEDRVQFGLNVSQMGFSDQFSSWATLGSSGRLGFGSSVGTGFRSLMGGPGGGPAGYTGPLTGGFAPSGLGPNSFSGMDLTSVAGEGSFEHGQFHFGVGLGSNSSRRGGRGGCGAAASGTGDNGTPLLGNILQFGSDDSGDASGASQYLTATSAASGNANASSDGDAIGSVLSATGSPSSTDVLAAPDLGSGAVPLGIGFFPGGSGFGGGFHGGEGFHPPGGGSFGALGTPDGRFTNGESFNQFVPGAFESNGPGTTPHFRIHGEFGPDLVTTTASVRVNLDRSNRPRDERAKITAIAADPQTEGTWVAMGSSLARLDRDGNLLDAFYLAAPDGSALNATALVVEPDRLIVATELLGIFEFARPDENGRAPAGQGSNSR
jgi:hypothetical protein